jgi:DNA polymerase
MFNAANLIWLDFEVASALDLKAAGTIRYATDPSTRAIVLAYAIGDGPERDWHADGAILNWDNAPDDLRTHVSQGAILAAWNASFDSAIWNYATLGFPFLEVERVIDPMIQAGVSNLPTDLESASRYLGGEGKQKDGKKLIKLFCVTGADPREYPEEWQLFLKYARRDVGEMRDAYRKTRPLPHKEWQEYQTFEHINRRGVVLDMPFVRRAAALAAEDGIVSGRRLAELTGGAVTRVTQAQRIATWLDDNLPDAAMRATITVGALADDSDDDDIDDEDNSGDDSGEETKLSLKRERVERLIAQLEIKQANGGLSNSETIALEVATLRLYGAGASPKKFARLEAQQVDGVLRDQYRFAGAGQTGRMSGKGVNTQNLSRDVLGEDGAAEASLVDMIADGCSYAELAAAEPVDVPVARKLALLVRPAIIAPPKKVLVWADYSAIEARITPWLANSPDAERVLDIFRANDRDPSLPDIYTIAAADIVHKAPSAIIKLERQIGKVSTLSCGFGGSVGALLRMALSFRIPLEPTEARRIVDAWRAANPWAREFWGKHTDSESFGLWGAAMSAWEMPGQITTAGRIAFIYHEDYLGGTLFMKLPSERWLTYPRPRWRDVDILDTDGKPTGEQRHELSFRRARGRVKLWHGTLCLAGDTLVLTESGWLRLDQLESQRVWDGEDFVAHGGVANNGRRLVIDLDGVAMTQDHKVLTAEGWQEAESVIRHSRTPINCALPTGQKSPVINPSRRQRNSIQPVFDILNAWPRHQFAVAGCSGPLIVHNCENAVQGTAADVLRYTAARIENNPVLKWLQIRMTTHDEIVGECDEDRIEEAKAVLRREMLTLPEWADGLPLQSEESECSYYTKAKAALLKR